MGIKIKKNQKVLLSYSQGVLGDGLTYSKNILHSSSDALS